VGRRPASRLNVNSDSGGPFFLAGSNIVVAITVTGFALNCGDGNLSLRIDTEPPLARGTSGTPL